MPEGEEAGRWSRRGVDSRKRGVGWGMAGSSAGGRREWGGWSGAEEDGQWSGSGNGEKAREREGVRGWWVQCCSRNRGRKKDGGAGGEGQRAEELGGGGMWQAELQPLQGPTLVSGTLPCLSSCPRSGTQAAGVCLPWGPRWGRRASALDPCSALPLVLSMSLTHPSRFPIGRASCASPGLSGPLL